MRHHHKFLALALASAAVTLTPAIAGASIGAGIGAGTIIPRQTVQLGGSTEMSGIYVVNTGTVASDYALSVKRLSSGAQQAIPASWIKLPTGPIRLQPKQGRLLPVQLRVPAHAKSGKYMTDIVAATSSAHHPGGGTAVGAAAATKLAFQVPGGGGFSLPGWLVPGIGAALVAIAGAWGIRRSGLSLRIERAR